MNILKTIIVSSLCLTAFMASISISLTQIFLAISLILALCVGCAKYKFSLFSLNFYRDKIKPYYYQSCIIGFLLIWILFRFTLVFLSNNPLIELKDCKELWLLTLIPLIIFYLSEKKWFESFIFALIAGASISGIYNTYKFLTSDFVFGYFRVGGFWDTNNPLTYTGITGLIYFIGVGFVAYLISQKRYIFLTVTSFLLLFVLAGFILSQSRGGYLAFLPAVFLFLFFIFKEKTFFAFPIVLIIIALTLNNTKGINDLFKRVKTDFIVELQQGQACGTLWSRLNLWEAGIQMWIHNPVLGVGNGDYVEEHQKYKSPQSCGVAGELTSHMHNDYLNALVLFGSIGLSLFLLFYFLPFAHAIDRIKEKKYSFHLVNNTIDHEKWILLGALSSILLMFFMGLLQCHFTDEEVQTVFLMVIGLCYRIET